MMTKISSGDKPVNIVKALAKEQLSSIMEKMQVPDTQENREDILALALNALPTQYVTTDKGKLYAQYVNVYRAQYETDITTCLTRACITVRERPRNNVNNDASNSEEKK